jgi:hypothetical protein
MTPSNEQSAIGSASNSHVLGTIDALSQLLALNSSIEQARDAIAEPFHISANRVTERAHPDAASSSQTLRGLAAPSILAIALSTASALLHPSSAAAAPNLSERELSERAS